MVYKLDFIFNIYCGTHMTDGVTDDIVWIQGTRMPWFNTGLGPEKRKKEKMQTTYICIIYLICNIYCIYLICILYILYIAYIYRAKVSGI